MKRATTVRLFAAGPGGVPVFSVDDLPPSLRSAVVWCYRVLLSVGADVGFGMMPGDEQAFSFDGPVVGGATGNSNTISVAQGQIEIPVHAPAIPSVYFNNPVGTDCVFSVCVEWDDGTTPPDYQRRSV